MSSKDLTFNLFSRDVTATAGLRRVAAAAETESKTVGRAFGRIPGMAALAVAGFAAVSVKMAADFQQASTRLVTDAGESARNLGMVKQGMLDISSSTGTSAADIASGMYLVESAGFHGKAGLDVMKAAAEGAKIGMADQKTVADALTTTMTDFGPKAGNAATVMSMLTATVSTGKTNMEALAGSLHSVLPGAAAAGLGLKEVLAAVGTMTGEGISADQATQNLNHSILSLQAPSQVATHAMAGIGVSSLDVAKNLGKRGLAGTYDLLLKSMHDHSKAGMVVVNAFNSSRQATASMASELAHLPAPLRASATAFQQGHLTSKQWAATLKTYPATVANLGKQFATTVKHSNGFSDALKSGEGPVRTSAAQLEKMLGGQTGLQVALHLTGDHMGAFTKNTKIIGAASAEAGGHVRGWKDTQKGFNVQAGIAVESVKNMGIGLGTFLLPGLTNAVKGFTGFAKGLRDGNPAAITLAAVIGGLAGALTAVYVAQKLFAAGAMIAQGVMGVVKVATLAWTAVQWVLNSALLANPITFIVVAIVGLIVMIVLLITHWKQVCKFLQDVWGAVCKWFADTLNMIGRVWSNLWQANATLLRTVWSAIVGVVKMYLGHMHDTIVGVITGVKNFFAGAGGWLLDAGRNMIQGLLNGAGSLLKNIGNFFLDLLPGWIVGPFKLALGIHSPSTVFHNFGTNIGQGLTNGILGTQKQVQSASNRLADTVIGMFEKRKGGISAAAERAGLSTIRSGTDALLAEAAKRATIIKQVSAAQKQLTKDLAAQKKASDSSLKDSVMNDGDVTKFGSAGDAVMGLADLVANTRRFKTDLQSLVRKGIDGNTLKQLIGAGVNGGGLKAADELLANPMDLKQIVALQNQLAGAAGSLASFAGQAEYGGTIARDRSRIATLRGAERVETWKMQHTAAGMINALAKETHVHIHLSGHYAGTKADLAKTITTAIRDEVRNGHLPKNVLTAL